MQKVILIGHRGAENRGCEAIVRSTIDLIREWYGNVKIIIPAIDYEADKLTNYGDNTLVVSGELRSKKKYSFYWWCKKILGLINRRLSLTFDYYNIIKCLKGVDLALAVGGDNFTNDYGHPRYFLDLNEVIKQRGIKLVIWGASIGPFHRNSKFNSIVDNLSNADLITVREQESIDYLKSVGICSNVRRVADPAFLLAPAVSDITSFLPDIGCSELIGFNVSPILSKYTNNTLNGDMIIQESVQFITQILRSGTYQIVLMPHVTKSSNDDNDYIYMSAIESALRHTNRVHLVSDKLNAREIKKIITSCRFFIGARTHVTIASLSSGVPTISIGYSVKAGGINNQIFGHQKYVLNISEYSSIALMTKFNIIKNEEQAIRLHLEKEIPTLKELARDNIEYLDQLFVGQQVVTTKRA